MEALESAMAGLSPQCLGLSSSAQDRVDLGGAVVSMEVYSDPSVSLVRALRVVPARTGLTRPQEVFILPRGAALPLHDHPDMTVLSKILWGRATVHQLHWTDESRMLANAWEPVRAVEGDVIGLQPRWANLHQIEACPEHGLAFADLFLPPYDHRSRCCTYYRPRGDTARTLPQLRAGEGVELERYSPRNLPFTHYVYAGPDPTPADDAGSQRGSESSS